MRGDEQDITLEYLKRCLEDFLALVGALLVAGIVGLGLYHKGIKVEFLKIEAIVQEIDDILAVQGLVLDEKSKVEQRGDIQCREGYGDLGLEKEGLNLRYVKGDVVVTDFANFQVVGVEEVNSSSEEYVNYEVTLRVENTAMGSGLYLQDSTDVVHNNSPIILVNTLGAGYKWYSLTLDDNSFNTVIPEGGVKEVKGKVDLPKGSIPFEMLIKYASNLDDIELVNLSYEVTTLELLEVNDIRFLADALFYADIGDTIKIGDVALESTAVSTRFVNSQYKAIRGEGNEDIGIFFDIESYVEGLNTVYGLYDFILVSKNGQAYRETVDIAVENQLNNYFFRPVLSTSVEDMVSTLENMVVSFEAPKGAYSLLIKNRLNLHKEGFRSDSSYLVCVDLSIE